MKNNIFTNNRLHLHNLYSAPRRFFKYFMTLFLALVLGGTGCSTVYKSTGDVMISYADDEAIPYLLKTDDVPMACAMSEAFAPFFFSFGEVTKSPDALKVLFYMTAGQCAEDQAIEEQLRYLRAVKQGNGLEAKDARTVQKRHLNRAAARYYLGYQAVTAAYAEPGGECPKLKTYQDEMYWLVGLLNGVQALFADMKSEGAENVPLDIASKVSRSAGCLDNDRWWGVPDALKGAVWAVIPGVAPKGVDPDQVLKRASAVGEKRRVRLAHLLEAQVHLSKGDRDKVKAVIRRNAELQTTKPADPAMKLFDKVAYLRLLALSDQLWSEAEGQRTPWLKYGTFWDDKVESEEEVMELDDLL